MRWQANTLAALAFVAWAAGACSAAEESSSIVERDLTPKKRVARAIEATLAAPSYRVTVSGDQPGVANEIFDKLPGRTRLSIEGSKDGLGSMTVGGVTYVGPIEGRWSASPASPEDTQNHFELPLRCIAREAEIEAAGDRFRYRLTVGDEDASGTVRLRDDKVEQVTFRDRGDNITLNFSYEDVPAIERPPDDRVVEGPPLPSFEPETPDPLVACAGLSGDG